MNNIIDISSLGINVDYLRSSSMCGIRSFLVRNSKYLKGRVLDYGCGEKPYKELVSGEYVPYDSGYHAIKNNYKYPMYNGHFDTVMMTQVIQFIPRLSKLISSFDTDFLILTFPINWYIVQSEDLFRYTPNGIKYLLRKIGFEIVESKTVSLIKLTDISLPLQHGVVAKKR